MGAQGPAGPPGPPGPPGEGSSESLERLLHFIREDIRRNAPVRPDEAPMEDVLGGGPPGAPPPPGGGRARRGTGARGSRDADPMAVEEMGGGGGGGPPGGGANKRRQRAASERPELTVLGGGGGGPPPPPGPHGSIASELLPTHMAIAQTLREISQQQRELAQATLIMEQQRQANEVTRSMEDFARREQTAAMIAEGLGRSVRAAESAAASPQRAHEMGLSAAQQFALQLQDAKRQERPMVNVVVNGGPPPPPPPPGTAPLEMVPAQPPNRMALAPVENPQIKRAASRAASEGEQAMAKRRPADELAKREPRALARLAIAAASGAAAGPEQPEEVPASSSAGPEYKRPGRVAPYAAANGALASRVVARLTGAGFDVGAAQRIVGKVARGEVDAGTALVNLHLDQSGGRPVARNISETAARAGSATGRFFGGKAHRLTSNPPDRRLRGKTPVAPSRGRSRSGARVNDRDL